MSVEQVVHCVKSYLTQYTWLQANVTACVHVHASPGEGHGDQSIDGVLVTICSCSHITIMQH